MAKKVILVVDDEQHMRNLLHIYLTQAGYDVKTAVDGNQAIRKVKEEKIDLVLLDIMIPDKDGWAVCQEIRDFSQVPIIMLTAKHETSDKVKGLKLGADDYLAKPFEESELLARMEAVFRRAKIEESEDVLEHKGITVNVKAHQVFYQGKEILLTPREYDILHTLMVNLGRVLSREQLLEIVWGYDFIGDPRTVDSHLKNLREKLRKAEVDVDDLIKTVWGLGYKMI